MKKVEIVKIKVAYHIGKVTDDYRLMRKRYDHAYRRDKQPITSIFDLKEFEKLEKQAKKAGLKKGAFLKQVYFAFQKKTADFARKKTERLQ